MNFALSDIKARRQISFEASPAIRRTHDPDQASDLRDTPSARSSSRAVKNHHNSAGHTIGKLQRSPKPPLGWIWGDWFRPWHRMFPSEASFNGDINRRREYTSLSLLKRLNRSRMAAKGRAYRHLDPVQYKARSSQSAMAPIWDPFDR
uniref:DUF4005 domain-containing protein n=1 Tax=Panagrellus redivivus TaxID=6233 RepID=A0A7E4WDM1_PANRE